VIEALLYRSLLELLPRFGLPGHRVIFLAVVVSFLLLVAGVDLATVTGELRLGRRLESRLRLAFQRKVARVSDRYFRSRLASDMAERNHSSHLLRTAPRLGGQILRAGFELILTAGAILWLAPGTAPVVLVTLAAALLIPMAGLRLLHERDLRVRSHLGGLSRFYLDALLGLVPLRVHGAENAIRSEHEALLVQWARARLGLQRVAVGLGGTQFLAGYGLIVLLLFSYLRGGGEPAAVLLLAYWALNLPVLGLELVSLIWRYPALRNVSLRLSEPLRAPEEIEVAPRSEGPSTAAAPSRGMSLGFEGVSVRPAGHAVLQAVHLTIEAGSHVAIVGRSGAGKTSLLALPLGWHFPDEGCVMVDGGILSGERLASVRRDIAWVDPEVQIWNRSFVDNLRYGNDARDVGPGVELADLLSVLKALPHGERTPLGEGGGLVSGGEGQRVRLGRAFLRKKVRLVLLDEPFRGLERKRRAELLARARRLWSDATLLCVTHDVAEAENFDRVLVLEAGRLVEDGSPKDLLELPDSRFARLRAAEQELETLWSEPSWRRWRLHEGRIHEHRRD
jgi:ATP-binding cassette subfamily B protein